MMYVMMLCVCVSQTDAKSSDAVDTAEEQD